MLGDSGKNMRGSQRAQRRGGRGHGIYKQAFVKQAEMACQAGFTDRELAELFGVSEMKLIPDCKEAGIAAWADLARLIHRGCEERLASVV